MWAPQLYDLESRAGLIVRPTPGAGTCTAAEKNEKALWLLLKKKEEG